MPASLPAVPTVPNLQRDIVASGPNPSILALTPAAWYLADYGTSTTTEDAGVSQWDDKSGNDRHLTQATAANQPLFKAAQMGTLPGLKFDGTSDFMMHLAGAAFLTSESHMVYMACVRHGSPAGTFRRHMALVASASSNDYDNVGSVVIDSNSGNTTIGVTRKSVQGGSVAHPGTGTPYIITSIWDGVGDLHTMRVNTTTNAIGRADAALNAARIVLGGGWVSSAAANFMPITVCELLVFNAFHDSTTRGQVLTYLQGRTGVAG